MRAEREAWPDVQAELDVATLVFLDESSVVTGLTRNYGWSAPGTPAYIERLVRPDRVSVIGAVALDGMRGTMCIEGTVDGDVFLEYLQHVLVPTLNPGDVVVMDNLSVHKVDGVEALVAEAGATVLYLPRYSPDLNPIEMLWGWAKAALRDVSARTVDSIIRLLGTTLTSLPNEHIAAWFKHCGYASAGPS